MREGGIQQRIGDTLGEPAGARIRFTELRARSLLNHCQSRRMPDCWTINPYRGCSFGCTYCYARYTHSFLGLEDPTAFEREIFVKRDAGTVLQREATAARLRARPIAIGTATDPYQPAEARYHVTADILTVLARYWGLRVSITTKSALIVRDRVLLQRLARRSTVRIHVSLACRDRALARRLDPGAPTPERRLHTVRALAEAGLAVGLSAVPILPGINDSEAALRELFEAARGQGVGWVQVAPLFLASASRRHFLRWLGESCTELRPRYGELFYS
ncbi:MAG: radical SAM protein, partial [Myxococcota bacterium]